MGDDTLQAEFTSLLKALSNSRDRLAAALGALDAEGAGTQSYDDDWSVAQVASHLGSGAEIYYKILEAGLDGSSAPGMEVNGPIWDRWNSLTPIEQVTQAIEYDARYVDRVASLTDEERERWSLDLYGEVRDITNMLRLRLTEHAVHTWDVVVAFEPEAVVADDAVAYAVDNLAMLAMWTGKPSEDPWHFQIETSDPSRTFSLAANSEGLRFNADDAADAPVLSMPAEAFVRLVYGRLDADHTPASVAATGEQLDAIRASFPGP